MATYVIGDVQGCFNELQTLLEIIKYNSQQDNLWFTGDLVNRGPQSLEVLRFVKKLPRVVCVLGNHDLTLLALAYTDLAIQEHNLNDILQAPDREELLSWLRYLPLLHQDETYNCIMVHAGIPPQWDIPNTIEYAAEAEAYLQGPHFCDFLLHMFGNQPSRWQNNLTGWPRYRFIINALTRIRFCDMEGNLNLTYKGMPSSAPTHIKPWFNYRNATEQEKTILFGHWAALNGKTDIPWIEALDTGCYWGGQLTALRLEDRQRFMVPCHRSD